RDGRTGLVLITNDSRVGRGHFIPPGGGGHPPPCRRDAIRENAAGTLNHKENHPMIAIRLTPAGLFLAAAVVLADPPKEGDKAPGFDVPATSIDKVLKDKKDAKHLSLTDLKGKTVVLFFYPKALTRGCTIESCGFRDLAKDFEAAGAVLVG